MNNSTITLITESIEGRYGNQIEDLLQAGYTIESEEQIFLLESGGATMRYVLVKDDRDSSLETRCHHDRSLNLPL